MPVVDVTDRFRVDRLVERARDHQSRDARVAGEQQEWVDHGPVDGVPSAVLPAPDASTSVATATRFGPGLLDDPTPELESSDGVLLLCGYDDGPADWLRTGEALSALWLRATLDGLSVVPLSQVIEVDETRAALQHEVLGGLAVPHLLVRLGLAGAQPEPAHQDRPPPGRGRPRGRVGLAHRRRVAIPLRGPHMATTSTGPDVGAGIGARTPYLMLAWPRSASRSTSGRGP